jgi:hypothetical protein
VSLLSEGEITAVFPSRSLAKGVLRRTGKSFLHIEFEFSREDGKY